MLSGNKKTYLNLNIVIINGDLLYILLWILFADAPYNLDFKCIATFGPKAVTQNGRSGTIIIFSAVVDNVEKFFCSVCTFS